MSKALALLESDGVLGGAEEDAVDAGLREKLDVVRKAKAPRRRRAKRLSEDGEEMQLDGTSEAHRG